MARVLAQNGFGEFEIKSTGFARQLKIVFRTLALRRQFVSNTADDQLSWRAARQREQERNACRQ